MVVGLNRIREAFSGFEDSYVVIGGTACEIIMRSNRRRFRMTKDIDMVLIVEGRLAEFGHVLENFITSGGYENWQKNDSGPHFYRFLHPHVPDYPVMVELFSSHPLFPLKADHGITPIHFADDITSLSAIMLDPSYYELMNQGRETLDGVSILGEGYLIPFKAKAWLDLLERRESGIHVDSKNIKKHRNDVLLLTDLLSPQASIPLSSEVKSDMGMFLDRLREEDLPLKDLGLDDETPEGIIGKLRGIYGC